jgi:Fic family protein
MNPQDFLHPSGRVSLSPTGYWSFLPNPFPPVLQWTDGLIQVLSDADRALGELKGLSNQLPNPNILVRPFVRREAVLSSRIEGTRASLADLFAYDAQQLQLFEDVADVREVHNYVTALEYGLHRLETLPLSLRLLREIHFHLRQGVRGEQMAPGDFRRTPNWIGPVGSTLTTAPYVPPPPDEMNLALGELEKYLHQPSDLPPLVRLGLIHYQFEAIHPFLDGNGRVGRLLISLLLGIWDLLPQPLLNLSAYFESHRNEYYAHLLAVSQRGTWEEWLIYFLRGVALEANDAVLRIRRLQTLRDEYRERIQSLRSAARLNRLLDHLFAQPIVTISDVQELLGVQFPAAQRYVDQLVKSKILREITGHARNRVYRADEILSALEDPVAECTS